MRRYIQIALLLLGIGVVIVLLVPSPRSNNRVDAEAHRIFPASEPKEDSPPKRVRSALNVTARGPRADPTDPSTISQLAPAIRTYQFLEEEKERFEIGPNARRRIEALQRKLFLDDYAYAAMANPEMNCADAEAVLAQLPGMAESGVLKNATQPISVPQSAEGDFRKMSEHCRLLLDRSGNPGFSNILQLLERRLGVVSLEAQTFIDACIYVGMKSYLEDLIEEEVSHSAKILQRMKSTFGNNSRAVSSHVESTQREIDRNRQVLTSYRAVFERRLGRSGANDIGLLMDELSKLKLERAGRELSVPCPDR